MVGGQLAHHWVPLPAQFGQTTVGDAVVPALPLAGDRLPESGRKRSTESPPPATVVPRTALSGLAFAYMATYRSASVLLSSDGTRTPGTAALFAEPARRGGIPPWAGDFRPANSAGNGPKNAVGKTFTLELPDGSTGKVVVQGLKSGKGGVVLALMGEDAPPF